MGDFVHTQGESRRQFTRLQHSIPLLKMILNGFVPDEDLCDIFQQQPTTLSSSWDADDERLNILNCKKEELLTL